MFIRKQFYIILSTCFFLIHSLVAGQDIVRDDRHECFMILIGKKATADGSVMLAHNNDLTGIESSHLVKYPLRTYGLNDSIVFPSGLTIPQADTTRKWLSLEIVKGYAEGDAVAINEYGVAIAGGVALKSDRNAHAAIADPLVKNGVTGGIRYIALQRSKSARECVKMTGRFYTKYGVTYPSGIGIADTNEIWYIESGGGHCWAAVRVPDSCFWPQANGYRIGYINPSDTLNYYCSPGLLRFCELHDLWKEEDGNFNFALAFGGGRRERNEKPFYDTRRIWRCIDLINPEMNLSPNSDHYPEFLVPSKKISVETCFHILRDRYQGTEFENIVDDSGIDGERPIASFKAVHSDVIQLMPGLPPEYCSLMWVGPGPSITTCYVPHFFNDSILPQYSSTSNGASIPSAFSIFRKLAESAGHNRQFLISIQNTFSPLEEKFINRVNYTLSEISKSEKINNQNPIENFRLMLIESTRQVLNKADSLYREKQKDNAK